MASAGAPGFGVPATCAFCAFWTMSFRPSTLIDSRSPSLKGKLESSVSFVGR